jgi:ribonuclease III
VTASRPPEAVLQDALGVPLDSALLRRALTHRSYAYEHGGLPTNERLEFLGDAVLGLVTCELLYRRFPEESEGELTRIKSVLVSRNTCAVVSEEMGLDEFMLLGKGLSMHEKIPLSIMAGVFESLVGGIYLDGGLEAAREFIESLFEVEIERATELTHLKNYKSQLQQVAQRLFNETPFYRVLDEKGPDHSKCFKVAAVIGNLLYPGAWGPNKKEAEQRAAQNALCEIEGQEIPYYSD